MPPQQPSVMKQERNKEKRVSVEADKRQAGKAIARKIGLTNRACESKEWKT